MVRNGRACRHGYAEARRANLKRLRISKGLTQGVLSDRSGFAQQYLSGLERGLRNPTVVTLFERAQALDVDHVQLILPDDEGKAAADLRSKKPRHG